jgi:hypothetical protein
MIEEYKSMAELLFIWKIIKTDKKKLNLQKKNISNVFIVKSKFFFFFFFFFKHLSIQSVIHFLDVCFQNVAYKFLDHPFESKNKKRSRIEN